MKIPDLNGKKPVIKLKDKSSNNVGSPTVRDVTQTQVIKLQKITRSKIEAIGGFATGLAHELNQPLTFINSVFDYLSNKMNKKELDEERAQKLISTAKQEIKRVSGILDNLYEFGEGNTGALVQVNLPSIVEGLLEIIKERMLNSSVEVKYTFSDDLPDIKGDLPQIKQGLMYLFENALEALSESDNDRKRIYIKANASQDGRFIVVKFANNGPKIPEKAVRKMFEPFYTTKEGPQHSGMGLPLLYSIIRNHNGIIHCLSNDDQNVVFEMTLPVFKTRA